MSENSQDSHPGFKQHSVVKCKCTIVYSEIMAKHVKLRSQQQSQQLGSQEMSESTLALPTEEDKGTRKDTRANSGSIEGVVYTNPTGRLFGPKKLGVTIDISPIACRS